jgi:predicted ATP-dependent endonuclease of OLD family
MKIKNIYLENFRGFFGTIQIPFNNLTVFIGKNDQGKSSILEALDIFINEGKGTVKIDSKDLNINAQNDGKNEFKIGIVFQKYPEELVIDETNKTSLKDEYLLNADNYLEIWKSFKNGKLQSTYLKCNHPSNDEFLKYLLTKKIKDLQDFVKEEKLECSDNRKSAALRQSIRSYYANKGGLTFEIVDIPIDSEGLKEIWNKLKIYLPVYALFHSDRKNVDQDDEIQDPLKVKIEQIFKRNDIQQKLNEIANEIDLEVKTIANSTVDQFKKLSQGETDIKPVIPETSQLKWKDVYKGIGFNTANDIPLNKRGSGTRRMVLLSSFLADIENNQEAKNNHIIYAIEEPETSLHPDLQMKLINALIELSNLPNYQIILTTHSPALIRLFQIDNIRFVEQENSITQVKSFDESVMDKIIKTMGLLPEIGKVVVCVEGTNDENFLLNINKEINELKSIIDLQSKINCGVLAFIPMHGSNLKDWINRYALKNTNAIEFHLYDKDADQKYKSNIKEVNTRNDGSFGTLTEKREIENYIPKGIIEKEFDIKLNLTPTENWDEVDVPVKVKEIKHELKESEIKSIICGKFSKKLTKNDLESLHAWDEVKSWFEKINELVSKVGKKIDND